MLTVSKPLEAQQLVTYHQNEYSNPRESYYLEDEEMAGQWNGKLAQRWGLQGPIQQEAFEKLANGYHHETGSQLIRFQPVKIITDSRTGKTKKTAEHRAGWDLTFSAPKSVSLACLVGNDQRIHQAHQEAVTEALKSIETYAQARMGGNTPAHTTGELLIARFEHDTARPVDGYAAPQLHTHCIVFNLQETSDQNGNRLVKALQPQELFRSQQYGTAIYRSVLAKKLKEFGYELEIGAYNQPEITGFSKEYLKANSLRRTEILEEATAIKERLERERRIQIKLGAGIKQVAAHNTRRQKIHDRREMQIKHLAVEMEHGFQAIKVVQQSRHNSNQWQQEKEQIKAQEAVTYGAASSTDNEAVMDRRHLEIKAINRALGQTSLEAIRAEISARQSRGELIEIHRENSISRLTTKKQLDLEQSNIHRVLNSKGQMKEVVNFEQLSAAVWEAEQRTGKELNTGQRQVITEILSSQDQIYGIQGAAGTGKTTALAVWYEAVKARGYEVKGFAPTTRAAKQLAEAGFETTTLQKFIARKPQVSHPIIYVLDESSLASSRAIKAFFSKVRPEDRVLLVGDVKQHQAIEAGSPFEQLQNAGMHTSYLTEIVRQKDHQLKQVVEKISAGEIQKALMELDFSGKVIEISDDSKRLQSISRDYVAQPEGTIVITPGNRDRRLLNRLIRTELQGQGKVGMEEVVFTVLVGRQGITATERTFAGSYLKADVLRYNRKSQAYGVQAGDYGKVVHIDQRENLLTVEMQDGRELTYDPRRLQGVSVYQEREFPFAPGDRVQFRAPQEKLKISNGEIGTIEKIENDALLIRLDQDNPKLKSRSVVVDLKEFKHLDYGYTVTSHSSQGQTVGRVIINANTNESDLLVNQRLAYVAISRARRDVTVYTDDRAQLAQALERQVNKAQALTELLQHQHQQVVNPDPTEQKYKQVSEIGFVY